MRKTIATAAFASVVLLAMTPTPARAQPTATTDMSIVDATKSACNKGVATWRVRPKITVNNGSDQDDTFTNVFYTGKYSTVNGGGQTDTSNTQIVDDGGLEPGVTIAPHTSQTFLPVVDITIACDANGATLFVNYDLVDGHKRFSAGAQFVTNGTSVPAGAVGAIGLAGAVGLGLLARRRFSGAAPTA